MPNASIGGLVSGLDTATIISQLMQLEALPQTNLKSKVSSEQRTVTALQTLNAKLASIATKAADLAKASGWSPMKATSSSEHVTVKAGDAAQAMAVSFTVDQLANSHQVAYSARGLTDRVVTADAVSLNIGGTTTTVATGDGSLQSLVEAINKANVGVQATAVKVEPQDVDGDGTVDQDVYRLRLVSSATGATSTFTIGGLDAVFAATEQVSAGSDAKITIGTGAAAVQTTSASNTFTGVAPGVDITLASNTPLGTTATLTVERDTKSLADSVKAMVDAVNLALDDINSLTSFDATTKKSGLLAGDATLRTVRNDLLSSVTIGVDGTSLATVGIQVDRYGKLTFDAEKFTEAYNADPAGTREKFSRSVAADGTALAPAAQGFAVRLESLAKRASNSTDGSLTSAIKGRTSAIDRMEDDIAAWDVRLDTRRSALQRQYAALEVALGKLQNQSSWLAGQIAGLPSYSSGS